MCDFVSKQLISLPNHEFRCRRNFVRVNFFDALARISDYVNDDDAFRDFICVDPRRFFSVVLNAITRINVTEKFRAHKTIESGGHIYSLTIVDGHEGTMNAAIGIFQHPATCVRPGYTYTTSALQRESAAPVTAHPRLSPPRP